MHSALVPPFHHCLALCPCPLPCWLLACGFPQLAAYCAPLACNPWCPSHRCFLPFWRVCGLRAEPRVCMCADRPGGAQRDRGNLPKLATANCGVFAPPGFALPYPAWIGRSAILAGRLPKWQVFCPVWDRDCSPHPALEISSQNCRLGIGRKWGFCSALRPPSRTAKSQNFGSGTGFAKVPFRRLLPIDAQPEPSPMLRGGGVPWQFGRSFPVWCPRRATPCVSGSLALTPLTTHAENTDDCTPSLCLLARA